MGDISKDVKFLMSLPRLGFTDNLFCLMNSVGKLGIDGHRNTCAFWHQGLEAMLERTVEQKNKYALAIDYDTYYTQYHIVDLYEWMESHPEIDALFPLQPGRANEHPMAVNWTNDEYRHVNYTRGGFTDGIVSCDSGHFGLTMLRVESIAKLSKPWFKSLLSPQNDWNEGKKDADIAFWIKFKKEGFKSYLADLYIGHFELMCSFSRPQEDNFKTLYVPSNDVVCGQLPTWAVPKSLQRAVDAGEVKIYKK